TDEDVALARLEEPRALDLARLEHDIPVGQDDRRSPAAKPFDDVERSRVQAVGEWVVHQVGGHCEQVDVRRMLDTVALQGAEVISISELREQLFKDRPIAVAAGGAEFAFEMALQIGLDPVVVQQCIVDIDQEDDRLGTCHGKYSGGAQDSRMHGSRSASDRATIGKLRAPAYLP